VPVSRASNQIPTLAGFGLIFSGLKSWRVDNSGPSSQTASPSFLTTLL